MLQYLLPLRLMQEVYHTIHVAGNYFSHSDKDSITVRLVVKAQSLQTESSGRITCRGLETSKRIPPILRQEYAIDKNIIRNYDYLEEMDMMHDSV